MAFARQRRRRQRSPRTSGERVYSVNGMGVRESGPGVRAAKADPRMR